MFGVKIYWNCGYIQNKKFPSKQERTEWLKRNKGSWSKLRYFKKKSRFIKITPEYKYTWYSGGFGVNTTTYGTTTSPTVWFWNTNSTDSTTTANWNWR